ncbi:MAG: GldG family protein [Nitrospinota bacterium]
MDRDQLLARIRASKPYGAALGAVLLVAGLLAYAIGGKVGLLPGLLLSAGAALLLLSIYLGYGELRSLLEKRWARAGANVALMVLLVLGIVVVVEALSFNHYKRWDLTKGGIHTLAPQTVAILKRLDAEKKRVRLTAFVREEDRAPVKQVLEKYAYHSSNFTFRFVDPDREPGITKRYEVTSYGTLVLEHGKKEQKIFSVEEEDIVNALLKVITDKKKVVYFAKGHGESDLEDVGKTGYSNARRAIEKENYEVKPLLLARAAKVPEDAAVLVVSGPKKAYLPGELAMVEEYIARGGNALFLLDPPFGGGIEPDANRSMKSFLAKYRVLVGDDVIVDRLSRLFGADYLMPVVSQYADHKITQDFRAASFWPVARSVDFKEEEKKGEKPKGAQPAKAKAKKKEQPFTLSGLVLASTGPGSWAETDLAELKRGTAALDEKKDRKGPVPVGVVVTVERKEKPKGARKKKVRSRLVVFGDSDFANNSNLGLSGNLDLFLNTISWLAEEESLISIRPKERGGSPLLITAREGRMAFWFPVVVLPAAVLLAGWGVYYRRRRLR